MASGNREVSVFGIGGGELALIIIVLLIFVGPDKLPQVAKTVGTGLRDLRRAANLAQHELRQGMEELTREVQDAAADVRTVVEQSMGEPEPTKTPAKTPAKPEPIASEPAAEEPDVLAHVRRRMASERVEAPAPWTIHREPEPMDDAGETPSETNRTRSKPTFRMPTADPLPGTKARAGAAEPAAVAA
ncbi:MAG: twin-arginine translocase TatA/TatE family subunit [Deltaproteobacteria bacterium]|nr:twin-arginine translocase TatA/TatE family subunit [Deltaproteobacteria bacterium]